jgi:hypothetical protein
MIVFLTNFGTDQESDKQNLESSSDIKLEMPETSLLKSNLKFHIHVKRRTMVCILFVKFHGSHY